MLQGWNKIYNEYFGSRSWKFIDEGISSGFKKFIEKNNFSDKKVLDLGCGQGQFLKFLEDLGFVGTGVDISEQAIQTAKKNLKVSELVVEDIFTYEIPQNYFDLIISVASIQHGTKQNINNLLKKIYLGLKPGGHIYLDFPSKNIWATFKKFRKISPGTVLPLEGPEQGIPHSFFTKDELGEMFKNYANLNIWEEKDRVLVVKGQKS